MLRTLDDPNRLARTFALVIPGYLTRRFNRLALHRGYQPIDLPSSEDVLAAFSGEVEAPRSAVQGNGSMQKAVNL